jgi:hypothetical protein
MITKNFIFITGKFFQTSSEEEESYENTLRRTIFAYESKRKFNAFLVHQKEDLEEIINKIEDDFVVLFLREIPKDEVIFITKNYLSGKNCRVFYEGDINIVGVTCYKEQLEYFILLEKKRDKTY